MMAARQICDLSQEWKCDADRQQHVQNMECNSVKIWPLMTNDQNSQSVVWGNVGVTWMFVF